MTTITLLSDFGSASPYPAEMKAVLLSLCRATLVDITHDITRHDVAQGAYVLAAAAPAFPTGTVHLAVVDPGVGTTRRPLAIASGGHAFVGPDNGLLLPAAGALGSPRAFVIDAGRLARRPLSTTFHGRDLFAPAAAALARGLPLEAVGPPAAAVTELQVEPPARDGTSLRGRVVYVDPFGNLVTNIPGGWLDGMPDDVALETPRGRVSARRARAYAEGGPDAPIVLTGSDGRIEIAINTGSAADALSLRAGVPITIRASA